MTMIPRAPFHVHHWDKPSNRTREISAGTHQKSILALALKPHIDNTVCKSITHLAYSLENRIHTHI